MTNRLTVAEQIEAARAAAKLTQLSLAEQMGVTVVTVSRWENGHQRPDDETLARLAKVLKTKFEITIG